MADAHDIEVLGVALAGGAVVTAILDELLNSGVLTNYEIRRLIQRASNSVAASYGTDIGLEAGRVIADLLARFPEESTQPSPK